MKLLTLLGMVVALLGMKAPLEAAGLIIQEVDKTHDFSADRQLMLSSFQSLHSEATNQRIFTNYENAIRQGNAAAHFYRAVSEESPKGESVGILLTGPRLLATDKDTHSYIYCLAVSPTCQGKGYGTELVNSLWTLYPKAQKIYLHVDLHNTKARNFYEKNGFMETKGSAKRPLPGKIELSLKRAKTYGFYGGLFKKVGEIFSRAI
jgi:ribosomal protein S18 acetylase RimI-like enzyme